MRVPWEACDFQTRVPRPGRRQIPARQPRFPPSIVPLPPKPTVLPLLPSSFSPPPCIPGFFRCSLAHYRVLLATRVYRRPSVEPAVPSRLELCVIHRYPPSPAIHRFPCGPAARRPPSAAGPPLPPQRFLLLPAGDGGRRLRPPRYRLP